MLGAWTAILSNLCLRRALDMRHPILNFQIVWILIELFVLVCNRQIRYFAHTESKVLLWNQRFFMVLLA